MKNGLSRFGQIILLLELYEVVGIVISVAAIGIFFMFAKRVDEIMGVSGYHWKIVNDVVGMYQNLITWVFTLVLIALLGLQFMLRRSDKHMLRKLAYLIRVLIAFLIMMAIYKVVNFYTSVFNPFDRDYVLQHIDRILFFGKLPSEWLEPMINLPLTWVLSVSYMSWFVLTYLTIILMMTNSRKAVVEYVFTAIFTFYIGYVTYMIVPAIGPIFTVHYAKSVGGIATVFMHDQSLIARDCFPSLHTGISIVMLINVWRYKRRWAWLYVPMVSLIIFSTLYLRFHYGIDVIAGTALALATTQLSPLLVRQWERLRLRHPTIKNMDISFQTPYALHTSKTS